MGASLKGRVALLWREHWWLFASLVAAVVAGILLSVAESWRLREQVQLDSAQRDAAMLLAAAVAQPQLAIDQAKRTLEAVGGFPDLVENPPRCKVFFDNRLQRDDLFVDLGIIKADGTTCGARLVNADGAWAPALPAKPVPLAVRPFPDQSGGAIAFMVPVDAGASAWAYAAVGTARLLGPMPVGAPPQTTRIVVDAAGAVLVADTPAPVAAEPALIRSFARAPVEGSVQVLESSDRRRAYHYRKLNDGTGEEVYFALGIAVQRLPYLGVIRVLGWIITIASVALLALGFADVRRAWHAAVAAVRPALLGAADRLQRGARRVGQWSGQRDPGPTTQQLEQANVALESSVRNLRQQTQEMAQLNEMSHLLQNCAAVGEVGEIVIRFAQQIFPNDAGILLLATPASDMVEERASWGRPGEEKSVFPFEDCWALRLGKPHRMEVPGAGPQCAHVGNLPDGGYLCLPLIAQGEILGVLHLQSKGRGARRPAISQQPLAQAFAERVALALANIQLRERFRAQSIRDPLTGLHNRRFLEETMAIEERRAQRGKDEIGMIMLDIDHFKRFNDTFGHDAGDAVLGAISRLLGAEVRGSDLACRYGGEEFVIALPKVGLEMTRQRAENLRRKAAELEVEHRGRVLGKVTLSLGVAVFPTHGANWQAVLKAADVALYRAKSGGRNRVEMARAGEVAAADAASVQKPG